MKTLWQDLRYAARVLRTRPGFTSAAVLSLALGLGACTIIFSIVDAVLLRPLPYPEADRVVQITEVSEKNSRITFAEPNFLDLRERGRSFEAIAQYANWPATVTGGSEPVRASRSQVSIDFFRVLGVRPVAGRTFTAEESRPGGAAVAVISYGFWQRLLGGRSDFAGTTLKVDDRSFTVVGVMPPGFGFPQNSEIWLPREQFPPQISRTAHNWRVVARLRSGVTLDGARADASVVGRQLREEHGKDTDAVDFALTPLHESLVGDVRNVLLIIFVAVAFLLLVACMNVANLLLAQATARQKEFAVRAALGATRWRLARQFITENVLLATAAGALGVLFSLWGVDLLTGLNQNSLPRHAEIGVDARVLLFTLGLALFIAVVLGLVPAARFSGEYLQAGLKESGRGQSADAATNRLRGLLVVSQIALTMILLVGAGLLGKSFYRLLQIDPGFRPESAVAMDLSLPSYEVDEGRMRQLMQTYEGLLKGEKAPDAAAPQPSLHDRREEQLRMFHQQLLDRLGGLPGVMAVGSINDLPLTDFAPDGTFLIDNNPALTGHAHYRTASSGYFAAMGIPVLRGRLFDESDKPESPHVAVISQSLAQKVWPNEDPVGRRIQFGNMDRDLRLLHIVGVVGDVRDEGLDAGVSPIVYANALQRPQGSSLSVVVRAQAGADALVPTMRQAVGSLNPELPTNFRTLEQIFSSSLDRRRFSLVVFGVFAAVALLLAVTGIYGMMTYAVGRRTQEIGIRIALGATVRDILKLIMGQGLRLIVPGVILGIAGALALTRLLASLLFGVSATDPLTFAGVALLLVAVALLACYIPARRATKVDPGVALRYE